MCVGGKGSEYVNRAVNVYCHLCVCVCVRPRAGCENCNSHLDACRIKPSI